MIRELKQNELWLLDEMLLGFIKETGMTAEEAIELINHLPDYVNMVYDLDGKLVSCIGYIPQANPIGVYLYTKPEFRKGAYGGLLWRRVLEDTNGLILVPAKGEEGLKRWTKMGMEPIFYMMRRVECLS